MTITGEMIVMITLDPTASIVVDRLVSRLSYQSLVALDNHRSFVGILYN
jgi:hypothetical protein